MPAQKTTLAYTPYSPTLVTDTRHTQKTTLVTYTPYSQGQPRLSPPALMAPTPKPSLETVDTVELAYTGGDQAPSRSPRQDKVAHGLKLASVAFSLLVAGVSDGSVGALLPYVLREYSVSTAVVSCMQVPVRRASP